jgi:hypothetical protein
MSFRWQITIEAWPYATGRGRAADQKDCGGREHVFQVVAHDMAGAFDRAQLLASGMRTNPAMWQAPITKIERCPHA